VAGGSGRVAAGELLGLRVELGPALGEGPLLGLELQLGLRLGGLGLVVLHQTLGLGLEDAQGPTAPPGQLGQLRGAEQQDQDGQDDEQLGRAESSH